MRAPRKHSKLLQAVLDGYIMHDTLPKRYHLCPRIRDMGRFCGLEIYATEIISDIEGVLGRHYTFEEYLRDTWPHIPVYDGRLMYRYRCEWLRTMIIQYQQKGM